MKPRLIDKLPCLAACVVCGRSAPERGPYLDRADEVDGRALYLCATHTASAVAALDVVPRADLEEARREQRLAEERMQAASAAFQTAERNAARADRLAAELEGARSQIASLERHRRELIGAPARQPREQLLAAAVASKPATLQAAPEPGTAEV
jgi:hypothetical protein